MTLRPFNSLFWRLFAGISVVMITVAACVSVLAYVSQRYSTEAGSINWRLSGYKAVEAALVAYQYGGREGLVDWLRGPTNRNPVVYLLSEDGSELSGRSVPERALSALREFDPKHRPGLGDQPARGGEAVRVVEIEGHPYTIFATLDETITARFRFFPWIHSRSVPVWVVVGLAILMTLVVAWVLALHYTRPLRRLDHAMERFSLGELNTRVEASLGSADSEVTTLARVFDQMADRIEALIGGQRRLLHDVSHEVRSPLARIEFALELARRDPARVPLSLERIEREVNTIDRMVEALLTFARLENPGTLHTAPLLLEELVDDAIEPLRFEAERSAVTVRLSADEEYLQRTELTADKGLLLRALDNLFRNALKHSPEGAEIEISVERRPDGVAIRCTDEGPGIPATEIKNIFRPFVRGSSESTGTGFGLGLAIAQRAVAAHGGTIEAHNRPDRSGLVIEVTLPAHVRP